MVPLSLEQNWRKHLLSEFAQLSILNKAFTVANKCGLGKNILAKSVLFHLKSTVRLSRSLVPSSASLTSFTSHGTNRL